VLKLAGFGWFPQEECAFGTSLEDVMPDIHRLMKSLAAHCVDTSNVNLHFDELLCELNVKLASVLQNRTVCFDSREKFFSFLKVSFRRHLNSTVQKYALTYKRTGAKPKATEEPDHEQPHCQRNRCEAADDYGAPTVSMDDDEMGAQHWLGETDERFDELSLSDEIRHFVAEHLSDDEKRVFFQEAEPNDAAMRLAYGMAQDARRTRKFRVLDKHKAEGIGMSIHAYKRHLDNIRSKMEEHWQFDRSRHDRHTANA
jgi:hypothetical protein